MRTDLFQRLPAPTAMLLLSSIFELTSAHVLQIPKQTPRPTATISYHVFNVVSWPLVATPAPRNPFDLFRRQDETNTICGYIGGNSDIPATCSAGSHCVVDKDLNVVGCCPNGEATCTSGVFTGCVDSNSSPQTGVNPLVFTCGAGNVCYKNVFDGGYSQFGCATSDLGTSVAGSATGLATTLVHPTISVSVTGTTISRPTISSTSASRTTTSTSQTSQASQTSPTPSSTTSAAVPVGAGAPGGDRVGPIVGGVLGGVSVFLALCAVLIFIIRRRRGNVRKGPGASGSETFISQPKPGPDTGFAPLPQSQDAYETGLGPGGPGAGGPPRPPPVTVVPVWAQDLNNKGPSPFAYHGAAGAHTSYPPPEGYHYPGQFPAAYAGAGTPVIITGAPAGVAYAQAYSDRKGKAPLDSDQVPLTRDMNDPGTGYQKGLGRIGEEDEDRERLGTGTSSGGDVSDMSGAQPGGSGNGQGQGQGQPGPNSPEEGSGSPSGRPLWQQNRRQSRNQMWM
ncbi:hypothetical protein QBC34DRAFT_407492 [Podospora aff. communis PSN243]|uniref:Mid2 domain-containing protein n=1 Tax=Podospora aff. communis PSN243 TaxID=3040156 RepID=A0AAV9GKN2_9PEZI|nr:hypothetical protein QBC34DRAFT_407492 [Podospora aff. communis PSN243]